MDGFLNPAEVLKKIKLKESMIAADFGSGSGGWVIPLAKILEDGRVYAIDILNEPLSALKMKASVQKLSNIIFIKSDIESPKGSTLHDSSCDLVLMTNLLFECKDIKSVLEEGKRVLNPGGIILVVDWKIDAVLGPKEGRISAQEIEKAAVEVGLSLEKEFDASAFHYGLVLVK